MADPIRRQISGKYCPRFGQVAIELGFINEAQLKEALCLQVEGDLAGDHRLLGAILFEHNWMDGAQIETVLNHLLKGMRSEGRVDPLD